MDSDKTVTVEFKEEPVFFHLYTSVVGGYGQISPPSGREYSPEDVVTLQATPDEGYRVKKWTNTVNDLSKEETNEVAMDSNKTVTVEFELIPCELPTDLILSGGSTIHVEPSRCPLRPGDTFNLIVFLDPYEQCFYIASSTPPFEVYPDICAFEPWLCQLDMIEICPDPVDPWQVPLPQQYTLRYVYDGNPVSISFYDVGWALFAEMVIPSG
jgi:hypothetical protein